LASTRRSFCENKVEEDVLPDLIEADLEKIGLPHRARKRILEAIAKLTSGAGVVVFRTSGGHRRAATARRSRRRLTSRRGSNARSLPACRRSAM
jgi:hypothetical protein